MLHPPRRPGFKPGSGHLGFCDGAGFLRELRFPLPIYIPSCFSTIIFIITRGWHNRAGVAAVPIASQTNDNKKNTMLQVRMSRVRFPMRSLFFFFSWPDPSSRNMALVSTHLRTEMSTMNLPGGKGQSTRKADKLTAICELIVYKMWEPWQPITGIVLPFADLRV
jgi:hypothetical protein